MKTSLILIMLSCILVSNTSCKKDNNTLQDAWLTGYDSRYCGCCGGVMINFDGNTTPYQGDVKLIDNVDYLGLSTNQTFPIHVKVSWKGSSNPCSSQQHIIITQIVKQ